MEKVLDFNKVIEAINRYFFDELKTSSTLQRRSIRSNLDLLGQRLAGKTNTIGSLSGTLFQRWFIEPIIEKSVSDDSFIYSIGNPLPYAGVHEIGAQFGRILNVTPRMRRFFFLYLKRAGIYQRDLAKSGKRQWIQKVTIPPRYYLSRDIEATFDRFVETMVDSGISEIPAIKMQIYNNVRKLFEGLGNA